MKILLALITSFVLASLSPASVTTKDLKSYLGIDSWESEVSLESKYYILQLFEIKDGKLVKEPIMSLDIDLPDQKSRGLKVLIGSQDGQFRFLIKTGNGQTYLTTKKIKEPKSKYTRTLPAKLAIGDYILTGRRLNPVNIKANEVKDHSHGFMLKIFLIK